MESWKKNLPGWEIRRWDESNSPMHHPFVQTMMRRGRVAFASDLIRLEALLECGGLYLDTDVELFQPPGALVEGNQLILGFHSVQNRLQKCALATCWIAAPPRCALLRGIRKHYETLQKAVMNNTLFTKEILPLLAGQKLPAGGNFDYLEAPGVRIYHQKYFDTKGSDAFSFEPIAKHHGTADWGGDADPLPWWRRLHDMRVDRKILRPIEQAIRALRK